MLRRLSTMQNVRIILFFETEKCILFVVSNLSMTLQCGTLQNFKSKRHPNTMKLLKLIVVFSLI